MVITLQVPKDAIAHTFKASTQLAKSGWIAGHRRQDALYPLSFMKLSGK